MNYSHTKLSVAIIVVTLLHIPVAPLHAFSCKLALASAVTTSSLGLYWLKNHLQSASLPTSCSVRPVSDHSLCAQEQAFLTLRDIVTRQAIHSLLGIHDTGKKAPRIAVSLSGGGYRAMITSLGWLKQAFESGLLNTITDIASVSGSTWAIAPWIASGLDVPSFITGQRARLKNGLIVLDKALYTGLLDVLSKKIAYKQGISAMDIYGPLLANILLEDLGNERITKPFSSTQARIAEGAYPLPLYTAINADTDPYDWIECTPFEIGSDYMKSFAPINCYGSFFKNGTASTIAPEQTLGYMIGIFGSAFEVSVEDFIIRELMPLVKKSESNQLVPSQLATLLDDIVNQNRLAPSELPNFAFGLAASPCAKDATLTLVDAGINFNHAIKPLLNPHRAIDIMIIIDASSDIAGAPELKLAEEYAHTNQLPFPTINYQDIDKKFMSIFYNKQDSTVPVVVYMPLIKNPAYSKTFDPATCTKSEYCSTFNFTYTPEQFDELSGLMAFNLKQSMNDIKNLIKYVMEHKQ